MRPNDNESSPRTRLGKNYSGWNVQLWSQKEKKNQEELLKIMLPRRRKGIDLSSYYRYLRVKLLPYNPYFSQDISDVRDLFKISFKQIADLDQIEDAEGKPIISENAAGFWLEIHRHYFLNIPLGDWVPPLPQWLIDSAQTSPELGENTQFSWLKKEPTIPDHFSKYFNLEIPLDRCVARLIERYRLTWLCRNNICRYIVTNRIKYLQSIFPFDVELTELTTGAEEAFMITIFGMDEFTTKRQWNDIFEWYLKPRQDFYWEKRGELPHSRQIDVNKLRKSLALELYNYMYGEKRAHRICGPDRAIEAFSRQGKLPPDGLERKSIYRLIKNLDNICKPLD